MKTKELEWLERLLETNSRNLTSYDSRIDFARDVGRACKMIFRNCEDYKDSELVNRAKPLYERAIKMLAGLNGNEVGFIHQIFTDTKSRYQRLVNPN